MPRTLFNGLSYTYVYLNCAHERATAATNTFTALMRKKHIENLSKNTNPLLGIRVISSFARDLREHI